MRKVNELMNMAKRYITVDTAARFQTASLWLLGCALITAIIPVRYFILLGGTPHELRGIVDGGSRHLTGSDCGCVS